MTDDRLPIALELARKVAAVSGNPLGRFISVGDIVCDVQGGLEFERLSSRMDRTKSVRMADAKHLPYLAPPK